MASLSNNSLTLTITMKDGVSKPLGDVEKAVGDVGDKSQVGFGKMAAMAGAVAGVVSSLATSAMAMLSNSITDAVKRVDTLNNAPKVLENLGFSAGDSTSAIKELDKGVRGLPTTLDDAASSLTKIASSSGLGLAASTKLTLAFNDMALAGGKGPAAAQQALEQFTQALGKGHFQMQDYQTLLDVMPAQLDQVAKTLLGPTGNAQNLGTEMTNGKISMKQFTDAVTALDTDGGSHFASFKKQAKDATDGIGTGFTNMQTAITRGMGNVIDAIGAKNISNALKGIGSAVDVIFTGISGFIKSVQPGLKVFGDALGAVWNQFKPTFDAIERNKPMMDAFHNVLIGLAIVIGGLLVAAFAAALAAISLAIGIFNVLQGAVRGIGDAIASVIWWLIQFGVNVATVASNAWNSVTTFFGGIGPWFTVRFTEAYNGIVGVFGKIGDFFGGLWGTIKSKFTSIGDVVGQAVSDGFKGALNAVLGWIQDRMNNMIGFVNGIIAKIDDITPGKLGRIPTVSLPHFATGTNYAPGGLSLVGERGPELVNLPRGASVTTAAQTEQNLRGGASAGVTINGGVNLYNQLSKEEFLRDLGWRMSIA